MTQHGERLEPTTTTRCRGALLAGTTGLTLASSLLVPMLTNAADAALPTKNTTYTGDVDGDGELGGTIRIRVGASRTKIVKVTAKADCGDRVEKLVFKDVVIDDEGKFVESRGLEGQIEGKFLTKNKVKGNVAGDLCGLFVGSYTARA